MREYIVHVKVDHVNQQFRFYLDDDEYYIYSEGLELVMDKQMKLLYCDMPEQWRLIAIKKLELFIKVEKLSTAHQKSTSD